MHAILRAADAGAYEVAGSGVGRYELSVGGETVFDGRLELPPGADIVEGLMIPPQAVHSVHLDAGEETAVMLAHEVGSFEAEIGDLGATFQLNLRPPHGSDDEEIERAVALARDADVAVVVVGTTEEVESEGFDRTSLALPGRQDELVRRVAQANPATVVVVNAGAPVLLPWADEVAAILVAWFPGQEFGDALADVVLGGSEPGGRLPTTWPSGEDGLPRPSRPAACSPTTRDCSSATARTTATAGRRITRSATGSATRPGATTRSTRRPRPRPATTARHRPREQHRHAAAAGRSSSSTRAVRTAASSDPSAGSPASRRSRRRPERPSPPP